MKPAVHSEEVTEIDFHDGPHWAHGVDLSRCLLPVDADGKFFSRLNENEKHAASWILGLLATSAIKEHEYILNALRKIACPKITSESMQFFLEEAIHASAFQRFLDLVAAELNLTKEELSSFLPKYKKNSLPGILYALEAKMGGNAIWWTVAATEEESIRLFQKLAPHKEAADPLFFELNRLHFLEESRHSSFSYKMLKDRSPSFMKKFSFASSRVLQTIWLFHELRTFRKIHQFKDRHPLLNEMCLVVNKIDSLTFRERLRLFLHDTSYIKMMTRPEEHPRLKRALERENVLVIRVPEVV